MTNFECETSLSLILNSQLITKAKAISCLKYLIDPFSKSRHWLSSQPNVNKLVLECTSAHYLTTSYELFDSTLKVSGITGTAINMYCMWICEHHVLNKPGKPAKHNKRECSLTPSHYLFETLQILICSNVLLIKPSVSYSTWNQPL